MNKSKDLQNDGLEDILRRGKTRTNTYPTMNKMQGTASFVGGLVSHLKCHDE